MAQQIYYVYDKKTGEFAGSGTVLIKNSDYDCTIIAPTEEELGKTSEPSYKLKWNGSSWGTEAISIQQL